MASACGPVRNWSPLLFSLTNASGRIFSSVAALDQTQRLVHQVHLGRRRIGRFLDQLDDLVDVADRQDQAFEDVGPLAAFLQQELAAPANDHLAVLDEMRRASA